MDFKVSDCAGSVRSYMQKYADQKIDFADACLIQMAEDEPRAMLVTCDRLLERVELFNRKRIDCILPPTAN